MLAKLKDWLYHQSQVTSFRINDEQLSRLGAIIDEDKGDMYLTPTRIHFKIHKRDWQRLQYLIY